MDPNDKVVIEKGMRTLWIIWAGIFGSLFVYVFICHQIGDEMRGNMNPNFPMGTFKNVLYFVVILTLIIMYFIRNKILSDNSKKSTIIVPNINFVPSQSPFLSKYLIATIVSLALSESIGIYGLLLFLLGDNYQTLYLFIGISAICMFCYRPKKEEIEKLAMAMKNKKKNFKISRFIAIIVFLSLAWGCLANSTVTVRDCSGAQLTLKESPRRIISTVPSNTEILYALGLQDQIVGLTKYCAKTCDTRGKVVIGGWTDLDWQKIVDLKPDLIFAFGGIQSKWHDKLREIAPTYCFEPSDVEDTLQTILNIGRLTKHDQKAKEIVKQQREVLARIQDKLASVPPEERLRVARVWGTDTKVRTLGRKSFLTDVIKLAGGENVFGNVDDDYFEVTFERLASIDPDVLIVHGEKKEEKKKMAAFRKNSEFSKLKAVKNGRVLVYSCDTICHANASIADTVEMVAKGLYPNIFQNNK